MFLGLKNRNIDTLNKNIAFLQNELKEKNKIIKSLMESLIKDRLKTTTEYSRTEHNGTSITRQD